MKERLAKDLVIGARVCWDHNPKDGGTVIEKGFNRLKVKWDDPSSGEISSLYYTEMANIGLLPMTGDLTVDENSCASGGSSGAWRIGK